MGERGEDDRAHVDAAAPAVSEDLLTALEVIEDQPLADRAAGYAGLHDELARRLEQSPPPASPASADPA